MSEEENTETQSDKEQNFAALREKLEATEARLKELEPLAVEKAVQAAGFDPNTPEGKALSRLAGSDSDAEAVKNLATELGFEAVEQDSPPDLSPNERAAQEFAERKQELDSVTQSDEPSDLGNQIAEAEAAAAKGEGDWSQVTALKLQQFQQAAQQRGL